MENIIKLIQAGTPELGAAKDVVLSRLIVPEIWCKINGLLKKESILIDHKNNKA